MSIEGSMEGCPRGRACSSPAGNGSLPEGGRGLYSRAERFKRSVQPAEEERRPLWYGTWDRLHMFVRVGFCAPGHAQDTPSLGDLARQAQKEKAKDPPKKVFTNDDLPPESPRFVLRRRPHFFGPGRGRRTASPAATSKPSAPPSPEQAAGATGSGNQQN